MSARIAVCFLVFAVTVDVVAASPGAAASTGFRREFRQGSGEGVPARADAASPGELRGLVRSKADNGALTPVAGANVFWLGTAIGTTTGADGVFAIRRVTGHHQLAVRHAAFLPDTLL